MVAWNDIFNAGGKYKHNPLAGPKPMVFPYTFSAKFAQFPWVYYYRYGMWLKPYILANIIASPLWYMWTKISCSPENTEKWRQIRHEWYSRKYDPENDYF